MTMSTIEYERYIKSLKSDMIPAALRGVKSGALRCLPILHKYTRMAPPANPQRKGTGGAVNTGQYLRSWKTGSITYGVRVFNDASYASVIEVGRRKRSKFPPQKPIAKWAQRRLGLSVEESEAAAFAIARAIAQRGLIGRKVMARAFPEMERAVLDDMMHEVDAVLKGGPK